MKSMRIGWCLPLWVWCVVKVSGLPTYDGFDYSVGAFLSGQTNKDGLVWTDTGSTGAPIVVGTGSLSVPGLALPEGQHVEIAAEGPGARLPIGKEVVQGTVYFSFALKVATLGQLEAGGGGLAGFNDAVGSTSVTALGTRVLTRLAAGGQGYNIGLAKTSSNPTDWTWSPDVFYPGDVVFLVGSYSFNLRADDDLAQLWINPNPSSFGDLTPPIPTLQNAVGSDLRQLASFVYLQSSSGAQPNLVYADELRIGATWISVTPPAVPMDFGDAPDQPYPTLLAHDGARHRIVPGWFLGNQVDAEFNGQPTGQATGDDLAGDDEDGVTLPTFLIRGNLANVEVVASTNGMLDAWIDYNHNGSWNDVGERIFNAKALTPGYNSLSFLVPPSAENGNTMSRWRFSKDGHLQPQGYANIGEVEDYQVTITNKQDLRADLSIDMVVDPNPIMLGMNCVYTLTVSNRGPDAVDNVLIDSTLTGLMFVSADVFQGTFSNTAANVLFSVGTLPSNTGGTIKLTCLFAPGDWNFLEGSVLITNKATISGNLPDPFTLNNTATVVLTGLEKMDFGDAPDKPYPTLLSHNGARHRIVDGWRLGNRIDAELNGQPQPNADGDDLADMDDEDGVVFPAPIQQGTAAEVKVYASTSGMLDAWIDFNRDGDWAETNEHVFTARPLSPGLNTLSFPVPKNAMLGVTASRWRFSDNGGLDPMGYWPIGEVEDYLVTITNRLENQADLAVNLTVTPNLVWEGEPVDYVIGVSNLGPTTANGVVVTLNAPTNISMILAKMFQGSVSNTPTGLVFNVGILAPNTGGLLKVNAAFKPGDWNSADDTVDLTNRVAVVGLEIDPVPANNEAVVVIQGRAKMDFGDAPDPTYPTLLANNGARHRLVDGWLLGNRLDTEADGQPNAAMTGDDTAGLADEDGVVFAGALVPGTTAKVQVRASCRGALDAWVDFNRDGDWTDRGERIFTAYSLAAGINTLSFAVPSNAVAGVTATRWRFSDQGGLGFTGFYRLGEVEDHRATITTMVIAADVGAGIQANPVAVTEGDAVDFEVVVTNKGPSTANGVVATLTLADGFQFKDCTPFQGSASNTLNNVVIDLGTLPAFSGGIVKIAANFVPDQWNYAGETVLLTNRLQIGALEPDPNPTNNQAVAVIEVRPLLDFGDAPDRPYPTLMASNGARHRITAGWFLGKAIDADANGLPTGNATGDDILGRPDDEDGVFLPPGIVPGVVATVNVLASTDGALDAWVDFNKDGDWDDRSERIFSAKRLSAGMNTLTFAVPAETPIGNLISRWRFSDQGGLPYTGFYRLGEVEDHQVIITNKYEPKADLTVTMRVSPNPAQEGDPVQYTIEVANNGPDTANGTIVTLQLPPVVSFVSSELFQGTCSNSPNGVICELGAMLPNSSGSIVIGGILSGSESGLNESDTVTNRVFISANEPDPHPNNNTMDVILIVHMALDYGDAVDPRYPALLVNNGARHRVVPGWHLGWRIDRETNGLPNATATGDDAAGGPDDEDGIGLPGALIQGGFANVMVVASTNGALDAWVDFNQDGDWNDANEQIFIARPVAAGANIFNFAIPRIALLGKTMSRWRFSDQGGLACTNYYRLGEVEDYQVTIKDEQTGQADLSITMQATSTEITEGGNVHFDIEVKNLGPNPASEVEATLVLDQGISFVSGTTFQGTLGNSPAGVLCQIGTMEANASGIITVEGTVAGGASSDAVVATLVNIAKVVIADVDPVPSNNVAVVELKGVGNVDFGDAPDPFPTILADGGAYHRITDLFLGARIDAERDGVPSPQATGDDFAGGPDDEDGVTFLGNFIPGTSLPLKIVASKVGYVNAWIDYNRNHVWDPAEQVLVSRLVNAGLNLLTIPVPAGIPPGYAFARFRLSTVPTLPATGYAPDGEVEDYRVYIRQPNLLSWANVVVSNGVPVVTWDAPGGVLEVSGDPNGPWISQPDATSPYSPTVKNQGAGFNAAATSPTGSGLSYYRVRASSGLSDLGYMVRRADLIFEGVVTRVEYRNSAPTATQKSGIPHTFVTFQVASTLMGHYEGSDNETLCLRFTGGLGLAGEILQSSYSTFFDVGERSLLFVRKHGETAIPLVNLNGGRFRFVIDEVFTENGRELLWTKEARVGYGQRQELTEVLENTIGDQVFRRVKGQKQLDPNETPVEPPNPGGTRIKPDEFKAYLNGIITQVHSQEELGRLPVVKNADINAQFTVPDPTPKTPRKIITD